MKTLIFENISKTFQDGSQTITALKPTNFSIEEGKFVAIIGPSGSGKSTFLTLAGGLQTPTAGRVLINQEDYSDLPEKNGPSSATVTSVLSSRPPISFLF